MGQTSTVKSTIQLLLIVALTQALIGCAAPYYGQAIKGQMQILKRREPIADLVADGNTEPALAKQLQTVLEIRRFAIDELGLPDNGSYASYADLERPFVVWNVVAADEFSVEPDRWCFLFVGCLAYRGFFSQQKAAAFAAKLQAKGRDVHTGGVTAYSTLGVFADPVLNTMLVRGDLYVASTIFHELAHQRVYIKNDSAFSEAFATVVEEYATEQWLRHLGQDDRVMGYRRRLQRRSEFGALVEQTRERLRSVYESDRSSDQKRAAKNDVLANMAIEYGRLKDTWDGANDYDGWFNRPMNNARLAALATYRRWVPGLRQQLQQHATLEDFFQLVEQTASLDESARQDKLQQWLDEATL